MNIDDFFKSHKKLIIGGILIVLLFWFWSSSGDSDAGSFGSGPMSVEECEASNMADLNQEFSNPNSDLYQGMAQCGRSKFFFCKISVIGAKHACESG